MCVCVCVCVCLGVCRFVFTVGGRLKLRAASGGSASFLPLLFAAELFILTNQCNSVFFFFPDVIINDADPIMWYLVIVSQQIFVKETGRPYKAGSKNG